MKNKIEWIGFLAHKTIHSSKIAHTNKLQKIKSLLNILSWNEIWRWCLIVHLLHIMGTLMAALCKAIVWNCFLLSKMHYSLIMAHESGIVEWKTNPLSMLNFGYTIEHLIQHLVNTLLLSLKKFPTTSIIYNANQREADCSNTLIL